MSRNRIANYARTDASFTRFTVSQPAPRMAAASGPQFVAFGPALAQQAQWQAQVFQLAYQQAVADLAPPVHFRRFAAWN